MEKFKVRIYSKKELALRYFPHTDNPRTAVNHLMAWIMHCNELRHKLEKDGYRKTCKYFTSRQVTLIIQYLGEP